MRIWNGPGVQLWKPAGSRIVVLACLALFTAAEPSMAATIAVSNASFESPALGSPGVSSPIPGWSGVGGVFRPIVGMHVASVPNGTQVAYILGAGSMLQDLGVAVQAGQVYQLDVYVGTQINFSGASYTVELLDGGSTVIASASGSRLQTDPFVLVSVTGAGAGAGNLRVRLTSSSGQPLFDAVSVQTQDSAVPEPSTLAGACIGIALLVGIAVLRKSRGSAGMFREGVHRALAHNRCRAFAQSRTA